MKKLALVIISSIISCLAIAQYPAPPIVHREIQWANMTPSGPAVFPETPYFIGQNMPVSQTQSAEDWWYDCKPLLENGNQVGYIVVGFTTYRNMRFSEHNLNPVGFFNQLNPTTPMGSSSDDCSRLLNKGETISQYRQVISRFNLKGEMIWCHPLNYSQALNSVIQDPITEAIYAVGSTEAAYKYGQNPEKYIYNPTGLPAPQSALVDLVNPVILSENPKIYQKKRALVYKFDTNGNTLWSHLYGSEDLSADINSNSEKIMNMDVEGLDLAMNDSGSELIIVGNASDGGQSNLPSGYQKMIFTARIDPLGNVLQKEIFDNSNVHWIKAFDCHNGVGVIVGGREQNPLSQNDAFIYQFNQSNLSTDITTTTSWASNPAYISLNGSTNPSLFGDVELIGPPNNTEIVVGGFDMVTNGGLGLSSGYNEGKAQIIKYDNQLNFLGGNNVTLCRAFDLKIGITKTNDNGFAVVSSVYNGQINFSNPPNSQKIQNYSNSILPSNCVNSTTGQIDQGGTWNTDTYVAKFDQYFAKKWETSFDSDDQAPDYVPGDLKKQECMYRISEGPDGKLFVVGNSSHNVDDYFSALIESDCQQNVAYDLPVIAMPQPGETVISIGTNVTWNINMKIKGIVRIQNGATLTIQNSTIEMANSQIVGLTTKFVVEKGGTLIVNNSTLTCIQECDKRFWDGIEVLGDQYINQVSGTGGQGKIVLSNSVIEYANEAIIPGNYSDFTKNGGIISARHTIFKNNNRSVQYLAYRNSNCQSCPEYNNLGKFTNCSFIWDNDFMKDCPQPAITMNGVLGVTLLGCIFDDQRTGITEIAKRAVGIFTIDAGYFVKGQSISGAYSTHPYYNTSGFNVGKFINMYKGIENLTGGSLRPFIVDHVEFTNCHKGVIANRTDNAKITRNRFIYEGNSLLPIGKRTAISLIESTSYSVEGNIIENDLPDYVSGTLADNTGIEENVIRKNIYRNLKRGNYAVGQNRHPEPSIITGLQYLCNIHENNEIDILNNSINEVQGIRLEQGANNSPTMNALTVNPPFGSVNIDTDDWETLTYFHSGPSPSTAGLVQLVLGGYESCASSFSNQHDERSMSDLLKNSELRLNPYLTNRMLTSVLEKEANEREIIELIDLRNHTTKEAELIDYYLGNGNLKMASISLDKLKTEVENIPLESIKSEMIDFITFKEYIIGQLKSSSVINTLTETQVIRLRGFRDNYSGIASQQASNILCFHIGECDIERIVPIQLSNREYKPTIELTESKEMLTIYPNPTNGQEVSIQLNKMYSGEMMVYSLDGKLLVSQSFIDASRLEIDLSKFESGTYIIKINTGLETFTKKLIKN
ncbi:MAG: T9SS type A sorting domain-containing protein [Crocinitomicaceae bacterium]